MSAFAVAATQAEVEAFRAATGCPQAGDILPLTFPMRWLASPDVRRALLDAVPEPGLMPVHEGQAFDYEQPLRIGEPYRLRLSTRCEAEPPRLVADAVIEDADGAVHAKLEMILRLVAVEAAA